MNMTAVAIVAIVGWVIVSIVESRKDKKRDVKNQAQAQLEQDFVALKERVEVLEKIVTDEKYDLHKAFDELKKDKVA